MAHPVSPLAPPTFPTLPPVKGVPEHFLQVDHQLDARFEAMDRMGIDLQVLSINPYWYRQGCDTAAAICRIHNESLAAICRTARSPASRSC